MPRILVVGYHPDFVDYSDPGLPSGLDSEKVWLSAKESLKRITDHGWEGVQCMVRPIERPLLKLSVLLQARSTTVS